MKTAPVITAFVAVSVMVVGSLEARAAVAPPACMVSLQPSAPSPQLAGERMTWTATAANCGAAPVYQFAVDAGVEDRDHGGWERERGRQRFAIVRDFSLDASFKWAPMEEGRYEIKVEVKDGFDAVTATSAVVSYDVNSRVTGDDAVISPTLNPLVALYSAPPCRHGDIRVRFRPAGGPAHAEWTSTNALPCERGQSRNFVVAGMLANTTYEMVHRGGDDDDATPLLFTTGTPPATLSIPAFTLTLIS